MLWFIGQQWLLLLLSALVGVLCGWVWWGRRWRMTEQTLETWTRQQRIDLEGVERERDRAEAERDRAIAEREKAEEARGRDKAALEQARQELEAALQAAGAARQEAQAAQDTARSATDNDAGQEARILSAEAEVLRVRAALADSDHERRRLQDALDAANLRATEAERLQTDLDACVGQRAEQAAAAVVVQAELDRLRAALAALDGGEVDDIERVEGIGPKIGAALRAAGFGTFRRLAVATVPALRAAIEAAGIRFAPSIDTWAEQAGYLARGDEAGFVALTTRLVAGRDEEGRE